MKNTEKYYRLNLQNLLILERAGKYEEAIFQLKGIWEDTNDFPKVEDFSAREAAEIYLRCGSLKGFLGHIKQIKDSQEKSKDLLTEAKKRFLDIYDAEKIAECENHLALAYWRTGELTEAETWVEEALSHRLPDSSDARIYSHLIKSQIDIARGKYEQAVSELKAVYPVAEKYADYFLKGSICTNLGIALRNLGELGKSLNFYKLGRKYHQKSGHKIYLGTVENNLAYLYKSEYDFENAHKCVDNAIQIYEEIKDKTRKGSSLDTKANIYFDEGRFDEALSTIEESIKILKRGENFSYLTESILTKSKILIFLDNYAAAALCLSEGIRIAEVRISEEAAGNLAKEFEIAIRKKSLAQNKDISAETRPENTQLELVLHTDLSHYENYQAVRIRNNYLEWFGLPKNSLAIVVKEKINSGDAVALREISDETVICGFYDSYFGMVSISGLGDEPILFKAEEVKILGKIIGVGVAKNSSDTKIFVEPLNITR